MGAHEAPDAVLTRLEADRLRARALELVNELDMINRTSLQHPEVYTSDVFRWAGKASVILAKLARG